MKSLSIAIFRHREDNIVQSRELPWEALVQCLNAHHQRESKDGPAWSPTRYLADYPRGRMGAEFITALVLDLDCGVSPDELRHLWDGLCYALHSTHRHTEVYPKFRVIFPLQEAVPAESWPELYERMALRLSQGLSDPACKDVSRIYYFPSAPLDTWEERFSFSCEGRFLDAAEYSKPFAPAEPDRANSRPGDDYNRRTDWETLLTRHRALPSPRGKDLWVRPGKHPREGHSATTRLRGGGLLYVFTSNWPPFEENKSYTKFAAYVLLEHGGDFSQAAKALVKEGYGSTEGEAKTPVSAASKLVRMIHEMGVKLHCSVQGQYFARISEPVPDLLRLNGAEFKDWLRRTYYQRFGKSVNEHAIAEATSIFACEARYGSSGRIDVHVRVAGDTQTIWIDLGMTTREVVKVTASGWEVVKDYPVHFWRPKNMRALPVPERGGQIMEIRRFINVGSESDLMLVLSWLIMAFHPQGPYPVLALVGERGTAKSTTARVLKELVDPSAVTLRNLPSDEKDLKVAAMNSHVLAFDNLSRIPSGMSDSLCKLATGGGISNRANYTDDEEAIFEGKRPMILTSIEDIVEKPDLVDRGLFPKLPPITQYGLEHILQREFEDSKGRLFGAILDALSMGLRNYGNIENTGAFRMADFAIFAEAASPAFGLGVSFRDVYAQNRSAVHESVSDASPLCLGILSLTQDGEWRGTSTDLVRALRHHVPDMEKRLIPSPGHIKSKLKTILPVLRQHGVTYEEGRSGNQRWMSFARFGESGVTVVTGVTFIPERVPAYGDASDTSGIDRELF